MSQFPTRENRMTIRRLLFVLATPVLALVVGCGATPSTPPPKAGPPETTVPADDKVRAALDKLPDADRKIAEDQKLCPITDEELGSMGVPVKVPLDGEVVFVCCKGCVEDAEKDPRGTLKKAAELKAKHAAK
jgi:hypothetical protein